MEFFKGLWRILVRACVHSLVSQTAGSLGHVFFTDIKTYLLRHVLFIFVCLKDELVHHDVERMNGTTVAVGYGGPLIKQTKRKHVRCIECRRYLLRIIVCEYDAIICELLCKVSWYTL